MDYILQYQQYICCGIRNTEIKALANFGCPNADPATSDEEDESLKNIATLLAQYYDAL